MIEEIQSKLSANLYTHSKREKRCRSKIWARFHEIREVATNKLIENFYYCLKCEAVLFSSSSDGNTNAFHRHQCFDSDEEMGATKKRKTNNENHILVKDDDKLALKIASAKFVAVDLRPYHAIDCQGLLDLCSAAMKFGQKYPSASETDLKRAMPTRNTVKATIGDIANSTRAKIADILEKAKVYGFSVTADNWTDKYLHNTYICVTAHCKIVTEFEIKKYDFVLCTNVITDLVKTKEIIVSRILHVLNEYGISASYAKDFITFVTDRGSNFKYGLTSAGYERLNCQAHLLHNLVSAMMQNDDMAEIIKNASKLTAYFKNQGLNTQLKTALKLYTSTRWNSIFIMLSEILNHFDDIVQILNERGRVLKKNNLLDLITCFDRDMLSAICAFLRPFKIMSDQLEGEYNTLDMVWPIFVNIQTLLAVNFDHAELDNLPAFDYIEEMKTAGRRYFNSNLNDFTPTERHKIATVLNPMMKQLPIINENEQQLIYDRIRQIIVIKTAEDQEANASVAANEPQPSTSTTSNDSKNLGPAFLHQFYSFGEKSAAENPSEFDEYLNLVIEKPSSKFNADEWWFAHRMQFPELFILFVKVSATPATSASSERDFSTAGLIVTDHRSVILPQNVDNIIVARNRFIKQKKKT